MTLLETGDMPSALQAAGEVPARPDRDDPRRARARAQARARALRRAGHRLDRRAARGGGEPGDPRRSRGFGAKAEENILAALAAFDAGDVPGLRMLLPKALAIADAIVAALREHPASEQVELAGSARRMADAVKDLDVIATAHEPVALAAALSELELIESTGRATDAGTRGRTHTGLQVDLRIVAPDQFGNLLQHFTGSKQHNMALREAAVRKGLHVSEYGILDDASGETLRCATEEEVYERLGYQYIAPELREGRGELEAAARGDLPELSPRTTSAATCTATRRRPTGAATLEEMAVAARERGFEYLAITDHSATHGFGDDVSPDQLREQIEQVHALNEKLDGIELLAGTEVNILPDGSLDYDDDLLAQLDWVIGSVHTSFRMAEKAMTDAHRGGDRAPAGRRHRPPDRAQDREPRALRVRHGAGDRGGGAHGHDARDQRRRRTAATSTRSTRARRRRRACRSSSNTDAHSLDDFGFRRWGIATARRAWLTRDQVANTRSWPEFAALRKRALV